MSAEQYHPAETSSEHAERARNHEPIHYEKTKITEQEVAINKLQELNHSKHAEELTVLIKAHILNGYDEQWAKDMVQKEWEANSQKWDLVQLFEAVNFQMAFRYPEYKTQYRQAKNQVEYMSKHVLLHCLSNAYYSNKHNQEEQARIANLYYEAYSIIN